MLESIAEPVRPELGGLPESAEQAAPRHRSVAREEMSPVVRTAWNAVAALGLCGAAVLIAEGRLEAAALTLVATVLVVLPGLPGARTGDRGEAAPPAFGKREMAVGGAVLAVLTGMIVYLVGGGHALAYFATVIACFAAKVAVEVGWRRSPAEMPASERFHELADPLRPLPAGSDGPDARRSPIASPAGEAPRRVQETEADGAAGTDA